MSSKIKTFSNKNVHETVIVNFFSSSIQFEMRIDCCCEKKTLAFIIWSSKCEKLLESEATRAQFQSKRTELTISCHWLSIKKPLKVRLTQKWWFWGGWTKIVDVVEEWFFSFCAMNSMYFHQCMECCYQQSLSKPNST